MERVVASEIELIPKDHTTETCAMPTPKKEDCSIDTSLLLTPEEEEGHSIETSAMPTPKKEDHSIETCASLTSEEECRSVKTSAMPTPKKEDHTTETCAMPTPKKEDCSIDTSLLLTPEEEEGHSIETSAMPTPKREDHSIETCVSLTSEEELHSVKTFAEPTPETNPGIKTCEVLSPKKEDHSIKTCAIPSSKSNPDIKTCAIPSSKSNPDIKTCAIPSSRVQESNNVPAKLLTKDDDDNNNGKIPSSREDLRSEMPSPTPPTHSLLPPGLTNLLQNCTITSNHVQIGTRNTMTLYGNQPERDYQTVAKNHSYGVDSNRNVTELDLNRIAEYLGKRWKIVGRYLGIPDHKLSNIEADNRLGIVEHSFQMLKMWSQNCEEGRGTVNTLSKALVDANCNDAIKFLNP